MAGIRDVEFSTDGRMLAVLIDVGGFLGIIGTRTVAAPMEQLDIHRSADLADVRVYLAMTEEELLALPTRERPRRHHAAGRGAAMAWTAEGPGAVQRHTPGIPQLRRGRT